MSDRRFNVQCVDHVQINVDDLAIARAFYGGLLGLPEAPRPATFGSVEGCFYRVGAVDIHLAMRADVSPRGSRHFCLRVDDVYAAHDALVSAGHRVEWERQRTFPGIERFFTWDPSGNRLELQGPSRTA